MTLFKKIMLPLTLASALLTACDEVSDNDRYIDMGKADIQRTVLLEDFTGQECVNCPTAHKVIEDLEKLYGENIIAVSIHGGAFAVSREKSYLPYYVGLGTPEGEIYNKGLDSWPKGRINRQGDPSDNDKWPELVRSAVQLPAEADIKVTATARDGHIDITTAVTPVAAYSGALQLWVLESSIVAIQKNGGEYELDYVHNNVLRAAVNGTDGEAISIPAGETRTFTHSIEVRDNSEEIWNVGNLSVVAFVSNSNGVGQVAKVAVTTDGTDE